MSSDSDTIGYLTDSSVENLAVAQSSQAVQKGRRNIRSVKHVDELSSETRLANIKEDERLRRVEKLKEKFILIEDTWEFNNKLILDYDFDAYSPLVVVHENLSSKLKEHQKAGVRFMWDACYESLEQIKKSDGSGCILAHCMGLGKTLQVITLVHTLLNNNETKTKTILICCPKNTIYNWVNEFKMWITPEMGSITVYNPTVHENHDEKLLELGMWQLQGGVCIINYELFRILLEDTQKKSSKKMPLKLKTKFKKLLLDPGPDLIVCDEGHILKNEDTRLSKTISQIRTLRRIVLTGTPMQNNLKEYHCMVQFVKPNLLGTRKEFLNMFVNPITNGQYENSLLRDVRLMKERSHILHKKLLGCVQRFDLSVLKQYLPEKHEYVILVPLSDTQIDMYRFYMANYSAKGDKTWKNQATKLFADYQALQRVWTHPYVLKQYEDKYAEMVQQGKMKRGRKRKEDYDSDDMNGSSDGEFNHWSRYPLSWWTRFVSIDDVEDTRQGNKLVLLLKILNECEEAGEKLLLFTGSLYSLRMIEHFLKRINRSEFENPSLCNMTSTWEENDDYVILTGQTSTKDRDLLCRRFNNKNDVRLRLFLISTKAGGMGINLTAANRAVIFDVSWNPSHDTQSTFRIYRMGQTKPCYIYRFVSSGTMEEKIYERQVAKQSISHRVVDELQTARLFTQTELSELYKLEPYKKNKINTTDLKDPLLTKLLCEDSDIIRGILEHDTLLEHKKEEELEEMEKNNAWSEYKKSNDFDILPDNVKAMLEDLRPEDFEPDCLRMVLENKFLQASKEDITQYMNDLKPEIDKILTQPDFTERMIHQALLAHGQTNSMGQTAKAQTTVRETLSSDDSIIILDDDDKENDDKLLSLSHRTVNLDDSSDSDDSVFKFECRGRKRKRSLKPIPIKSWGARNGKKYGIPDSD
ncbi:hypothetical protein RUM43_004374 [Polyplax serrata]|uniref:Uncharacterized protein n=1 Tax=Polyplax serrata TaxID=468196 RepID=A0AAN8SAW3_POLSC